MKFTIANVLLPSALFFFSTYALPTGEGTTKHFARTLGVDALKAPEIVERYDQSPAISYEDNELELASSDPLQKRDYERIVLCGGVQQATQCAGASGGFGQCVDTYTLRILDESQRIVFNQPKTYLHGTVSGLGADPCGKSFYDGKAGDNQNGISINCSKPWNDARDGDFIAYAIRAKAGAITLFYCRRVKASGDRNWCEYKTNGLLSLRHVRDFECSEF
ncbi:hypothetical protein BJ508DRAFT_341734 [Ascobolus immersus RN42]|uniref:Uncharacterized protein n=1 Tax=Ascobolus immersus RN42 TaxID=1160509 RepID=A0A3N4HID8_ASCIM|nr:hypothetical protein BJ508DRAFT_341734 [Ascobolus immersus RN42]